MKFVGLLLLAIGMAAGQSWNKYLTMPSEEIFSGEHGVAPGFSPTSCRCGWSNRGGFSRIVNGQETGINQFPFAVFLQFSLNRTHVSNCGGTIISEYHVLTAAHCTKSFAPDKVKVVVGEHDLYDRRETDATQVIPVESITNHPDYNRYNDKANDIALITLKNRIVFTNKVGPACLPTGRGALNLEDKYVKVMGWGAIAYQARGSNKLLHTNLRVISMNVCNKYYSRVSTSNPTQICTFSKGRDSCQGDSGGPVVYVDPDTNRYTVVGVVSYGRVCASNDPAVNTDVSAFLDWIQTTMRRTNPNGRTCSKI